MEVKGKMERGFQEEKYGGKDKKLKRLCERE